MSKDKLQDIKYYYTRDLNNYVEYQKAKECVLFEGFEVKEFPERLSFFYKRQGYYSLFIYKK